MDDYIHEYMMINDCQWHSEVDNVYLFMTERNFDAGEEGNYLKSFSLNTDFFVLMLIKRDSKQLEMDRKVIRVGIAERAPTAYLRAYNQKIEKDITVSEMLELIKENYDEIKEVIE